MVTHDRQIQNVDSINTTNVTFYGLSTDAKPTEGVGNGSCFIEMDTGKGYFFDVENNEWHEQSGGSGGGGGSGVEPIVTRMVDGYTDKTAKEILDAFKEGIPVVLVADDLSGSLIYALVNLEYYPDYDSGNPYYTANFGHSNLISYSDNEGFHYSD